MSFIILNSISKSYDDTSIIHNLNLKIEEKECVVIVGPSGCGKSTLMRLIAGLDDIDRGVIMIGGNTVHHLPPNRRGIAMVFQSYALYPHMNVFQNMSFGLKLSRYNKKEMKQRVYEAADILQISDLLDRKPKQLSGGQRQRVAIGRAIVRKPRVLLLDEPLSNLDAQLRVQMRQEFLKLKDVLDTTMIYVTHDQREAMTLSDKIVVMNKGHVEQIGTADDIYNRPENTFVAGFLGSPRMNFIQAKVTKSDDQSVSFLVGKDKSLNLYIQSRELQTGDDITIALRSNELFIDKTASHSIKGKILGMEYYGEARSLYIDIGQEKPIIVKTKDMVLKKGETIDLYFEAPSCHFFTKSGKRLEVEYHPETVTIPLKYANDY